MITNFEDITHDLSDDELKLANTLIKHFEKRTKDNPVLAKDIVEGVNRTYNLPFKFNDVRLRKIINYYRTYSIIPVLSNSKGYYVSYDEEEIRNNMKSLTERASSLFGCIHGLERYIKNNL